MSRYLVTGATGFLGRHLVDQLAAADHEVVALSRSGATWASSSVIDRRGDVNDGASVRDAAAGCDAAFHCAGLVSRVVPAADLVEEAVKAAETIAWDSLPTTMVMEETASPRPTHIRIRGVYHQHGPEVQPGVPAVFPRLPTSVIDDKVSVTDDKGSVTDDKVDAPSNRLAFARWLVSGEQPLTALVAVNRFWQE